MQLPNIIITYASVNAANTSIGPSHHKMVVLLVYFIKDTCLNAEQLFRWGQ
jgi:hypothetical protein